MENERIPNVRDEAIGKVITDFCYGTCQHERGYNGCNPFKCEYFNKEIDIQINKYFTVEQLLDIDKVKVKAWSENIMEHKTDCGDYYTIILDIGLYVKIDKDDYERTKPIQWHLKRSDGNRIYVASSKWPNKTIYMHRYIMRATKGKEVHHINGDGLDNRKSNLKIVSTSENQKSKKYKR